MVKQARVPKDGGGGPPVHVEPAPKHQKTHNVFIYVGIALAIIAIIVAASH